MKATAAKRTTAVLLCILFATLAVPDGAISAPYNWPADQEQFTQKSTNDGYDVESTPRASVSGNTLNVKGSTTYGGLAGGFAINNEDSNEGDASNNHVNVYSGNIGGAGPIGGDLYGGHVMNGNASYNIVKVYGGKFNDSVFGGHVSDSGVMGNAVSNRVEIYKGVIGSDVFGATGGKDRTERNSVLIKPLNNNDVVVHGDVLGGGAEFGRVSYNTVRIEGGPFDFTHTSSTPHFLGYVRSIAGGIASSIGGAYYNTLEITGGTFVSPDGVRTVAAGGLIAHNPSVSPGEYNADVANNTVDISGGNIAIPVYGGALLDISSKGEIYTGEIRDNRVNISGGEVTKSVYGGYAEQGNVSRNTVVISGGTFSSNVRSGVTINGNATSNSVTINGVTVATDVTGGSVSQIGVGMLRATAWSSATARWETTS
jgi:hypothetical protein